MASPHRKIELQSPADLTYLTTLLRHTALQKLNLHLPAIPASASASASPDDLRARVEHLVDAFVARMLAGVRENISINGMDVRGEGDSGGEKEVDAQADVDVNVEYEAYDAGVGRRVEAMARRRDRLVGEVSAHRRGTGAQAGRRWEAVWGEMEREMELQMQMQAEEQADGGKQVGMEVRLERAQEVRRNWEGAVQGLHRLNKGLPETRARLERCGDVVGYLGGKAE